MLESELLLVSFWTTGNAISFLSLSLAFGHVFT